MIKVLIVDDERILTESLKVIIEQDIDINVVGIADNGFQAADMVEKFKPDIVLMDLKMPECDGIESTKLIKQKNKTIKIIIMSTNCTNTDISETISNGVNGYIMKDIFPDELIMAIKSVQSGLNVFDPSVFNNKGGIVVTRSKLDTKNILDFELNDREKIILKLISEGKDNKQIAESIDLSVGTVANTISNMLKTLNLDNRISLAVYAVKNGLV
ncbi:MAG: response regulator transcription factor [Clostridia bacterium]|nr:response regulator transcription factor [Clostridia bacterium]